MMEKTVENIDKDDLEEGLPQCHIQNSDGNKYLFSSDPEQYNYFFCDGWQKSPPRLDSDRKPPYGRGTKQPTAPSLALVCTCLIMCCMY